MAVTNHVSGHFDLVDHFGRPVTESSYAGMHLLVYFGFTHCKVVCPRTLGKLSRVLERLGPLAERVKPLYITVDPVRDTPAVMRQFLEARYPVFTGLTGRADQVDVAKKSFRVFAQTAAQYASDIEYTVPHSALTYFMGPMGSYITHFADSAEEQQIVERLNSEFSASRTETRSEAAR